MDKITPNCKCVGTVKCCGCRSDRQIIIIIYNNDLLDKTYPVGSIYISINNTDPGSLFGGTWVQIEDRFLLAAGSSYTAGNTGGSADAVVVSHTHTVSVSGGNHRHGSLMHTGGSGDYAGSGAGSLTASNIYGYSTYSGNLSMSGTASAPTGAVSGTGANMPPYLVVYMWKRTA